MKKEMRRSKKMGNTITDCHKTSWPIWKWVNIRRINSQSTENVCKQPKISIPSRSLRISSSLTNMQSFSSKRTTKRRMTERPKVSKKILIWNTFNMTIFLMLKTTKKKCLTFLDFMQKSLTSIKLWILSSALLTALNSSRKLGFLSINYTTQFLSSITRSNKLKKILIANDKT